MSTRALSSLEITEARIVFGNSLNYTRVRIVEKVRWPDLLAQFSAWVGRRPAPTHNAVTLGNRLYFPVNLRTPPTIESVVAINDMAWLIHELTHAWQYQNQGIGYLWGALMAQIKYGPEAYDYGWEQGLNEAQMRGETLFDFNPEQQGDIARHYYYRHKQGLDTQAWDPFVLFFKSP
jgi:hypothetical protein